MPELSEGGTGADRDDGAALGSPIAGISFRRLLLSRREGIAAGSSRDFTVVLLNFVGVGNEFTALYCPICKNRMANFRHHKSPKATSSSQDSQIAGAKKKPNSRRDIVSSGRLAIRCHAR